MSEELTPEQQEKLNKLPEPLKKIALDINNLDAPYCYAVIDSINRYNNDLDVPDSVINAMGSDGMQVWVDYLAIMSFVKSNTKQVNGN